ncbi:MAG: nitrite reductase large subunit NirB [Chloroflexota bacterium]
MADKLKLIVVGNGMVGYKFIEKLTEQDTDGRYQIITFCEEPRPAYDRVKLSTYFSGSTVDDLTLAALSWYEEKHVELYLNDAVIAINSASKSVRSKQGREMSYDKLVLATGSYPFVPPIPGIEKEGVFVYRTIEDLDQIIDYSNRCKSAAVIGGGLLGLEAANALVNLKLETSVVEFAPYLMPRQVDQQGSAFLQRKIEDLNVNVLTNTATQEIAGNSSVTAMRFSDDSQLEVDMIVVSAGIRPRDELAQEYGLAIGPRGGICVNDSMQTSDPDIYAIGECALHREMIYGLVAPGYRMAETACAHLLEEEASFTSADMSTKLKLMGVDVASVGNTAPAGDNIESVVFMDSRAGVYKKMFFDIKENTVQGAILVGNADDYGNLLQMYLNRMKLPESPESLIVQGGETNGQAGVGVGVDALPETAQICSCENVYKGTIVQNIQEGCHDVGTIKACTKAGTGCGSCVPLLNDILTIELERAGITVDKSLCEHFSYTRQELVEIVKIARVKTFDELLGTYGQGRGCEICKPAVASILASYWNEYVMEHQTIQDTNDFYLANMQKNGTYSVIPRVPGGEITPEQLIRMGEVAKEFSLYTKITGGQRIDLFGARLEDLPKIWSRLGEVGLESGHAYAKALRTVKSCVGSSWCRFGVQDSTSLAIRVESRYKGLRAPHKLKMAVSGCARECAEAQGKDVGIIATENGWNLYVCGNGGMKPQHAQLLATDIDEEILIRYIDRFLMYYVRTADKLTRTATWLNKLPGGMEKVKEVVVDDSLGLAVELEREMQHIVDTYVCEWKKTTETPEMLTRFRPFINVEEPDPTIQFDLVRGQPQPV